MSLIARALEDDGLPTLILGAALDILEAGRAPRVQFLDFPLGFSAGPYNDPSEQTAILRSALAGFDAMTAPTIDQLPFTWQAGWEMIEAREDADAGTDTRSPRDTTPRYQTEEDRLLAERAAGS